MKPDPHTKPSHLVTLPAVVGLLLVALAVPGFFMLRRAVGLTETPTTQSVSASQAAQHPAERPTPSSTSPAVSARTAQVHATGRTPKPSPEPPERRSIRQPESPATVKPHTSANPKVEPATFDGVKVVVSEGDSLKERDAILTLTGDSVSALDPAEKSEILRLPYRSIVQAFYSRSRQPRWKGADGKAEVARVDLGKLGFLRGEGHWLILTTRAHPVFIRFESTHPWTALPAIQERIGVEIQR